MALTVSVLLCRRTADSHGGSSFGKGAAALLLRLALVFLCCFLGLADPPDLLRNSSSLSDMAAAAAMRHRKAQRARPVRRPHHMRLAMVHKYLAEVLGIVRLDGTPHLSGFGAMA